MCMYGWYGTIHMFPNANHTYAEELLVAFTVLWLHHRCLEATHSTAIKQPTT
jgi:hypothetical protein